MPAKINSETERLTANINSLQNLLCQLKLQKDPENRKEIQKVIHYLIEANKVNSHTNKHTDWAGASRNKALKAHYDELVKEFNDFVSEEAQNLYEEEIESPTMKQKADIDLHLKEIEFDPDEEKKEELETLKYIKAVKQVTCQLVDGANVKIKEQGEAMEVVEVNSEMTVIRTEQAMKELKEVAKVKRTSKFLLVKIASAAIGWIAGGTVGGVVGGLGSHVALNKAATMQDKKLDAVAKA